MRNAALDRRRNGLLLRPGMDDDQLGLGVVHELHELAVRMGERQGNDDASGAPDAPLRGHEFESRRHQQNDAGLVQVGPLAA